MSIRKMASFYKSLLKPSPKAEGKQAQGRVKVNASGHNSISLLLPTSSWQTIIQLLMTENQRLQKQIQCFLQHDKPVRTPQVDLTNRATQNARSDRLLKQPVRRVKKQGKQFSCQSCVEVPSRVVSTWPYQRRELSPPSQRQEIFRQAVSTTLPFSVAEEQLTRSTGSASQTQKTFCGVSRASQTDPEKEDRGVNTKLNFKQPKVLPPTSTTQPKRSSLDMNMPTTQSCPKVESEHQQTELIQLVKPVEQKLKRWITKGPPEVRQCFYCHSESHQIKSCEIYQQKKRRRREDNTRKVVQVSTANNNRVWCKEEKTDEQRILIASTTESSILTEQTSLSLLSAAKVNAQATPMNNTSLKGPEIGVTSKVLSSAKDSAPTTATQNVSVKAPETSGSSTICTAQKITEQLLQSVQKEFSENKAKLCPENVQQRQEEKPPNKLKLKIPENSSELATVVKWKIDNLFATDKIHVCSKVPRFCAYCRKECHFVSDCSALKEKSIELKRSEKKACLMCETDHEMLTCEWLQILHTFHSITMLSRDKLGEMYLFFRRFFADKYTVRYNEFAWENMTAVVEKINWKKFGIETAQPYK